jgi:hypothetical protein
MIMLHPQKVVQMSWILRHFRDFVTFQDNRRLQRNNQTTCAKSELGGLPDRHFFMGEIWSALSPYTL